MTQVVLQGKCAVTFREIILFRTLFCFFITFLPFRSDDTARSEVESRGEPEGGDDTPPCKSSNDLTY